MKYRYKLMAGFLIILCLSFSVSGGVLLYNSFQYSYTNETNKCLQNFASIQNTLKVASDSNTKNYAATISNVIKTLDNENSKSYETIELKNATTENLLYSSSNKYELKDLNIGNQYNGKIYTYFFRRDNAYLYQITGDISITSKHEETQIIRLSVLYDISTVYIFRNRQVALYKKIIILFLLCGIILSCTFAIWITKPIYKLSKVIKQIASGNLGCRCNIATGDEIEALSKDVNSMADEIEANVSELKKHAKKQEEFMGSFAHEMKTPMTSIIGYADLMRSQSMNSDEIQEAANYIFSEGKRLEALSLKMLDLIIVNNDNHPLSADNPRDSILEVAKMLRIGLKQKNITLTTNCQNGRIMMDKDLFKSLITNLCDNAAKAMDNGGKINIHGKIIDDNYVILIKDNGRGMSKEDLAHITEAFYRVDKSRSRAQGGAGLGLAICQKIISLHNGSMKYKSELGIGTTVRLSFKEVSANEVD